MTLNTNLRLQLDAKQSSTLDVGSRLASILADWGMVWTDGAGASAANLLYQDTATIGASATITIDLAGGGLVDPFNTALTFARIKALWVRARSTNNAANNVIVQRPAANGVPFFGAAGDNIALQPGAIFGWMSPSATGVVVTAGTGDLIDFVNSAGTNTVDFDVVILGAAT